jgi:lon-related putative ATP-dependent protease
VVAYLNALQDDIVANIGLFRGQSETQSPIPGVDTLFREMTFRRYQVNVLVDNSSLQGAPVVMELNPTYLNLFGRIEREAQFGAMVTDFTLIKGGSLHRANGGYLVLHAEEVLSNPFSWDSLKRAIRDRSISIEDVGERLGFVPTKGVMPEAVPLDIKIVLVGTPLTYRLLYGLDEEFNELFKVKADFDSVMDRSGENVRAYAAFIATMVQKENLHQFDSGAVAKVIEHSSRLVEDQEKLSTRFADIADLVREASFWASQDKAAVVTEAHVRRAIEERIYRSNLVQERQRELIERGTLLIDVQGQAIGQVNGLTVIDLGDFAFGRPVRITASLGLGRDGVVDIQREAQLSGKIHTKGVMILGGYLTEKYAHDKPLTLSSRLVFEQSYEEVEGDSASSAELYAILSQLSGLPIQQGLAVTGSVNQKGEVQAIGGVNEKIEGFFEACRIKGLTDKQGVLIPASNVSNLMLKEEVIAAVGQSQFHIYPVRTIDDGIAILTGTPAGERGADGEFPESTVNARVNQKLRELAEGMKEFPKKEEERDEQD